MGHSIDGGRDDFGDDDYGRDRAPRGRRARVIVDDSYGGDFDDAPPRAAGRFDDDDPGYADGPGYADEPGYADGSEMDSYGAESGRRRGTAPRETTRAVVPRGARAAAPVERGGRGGSRASGSGGGATMSALFATLLWICGVAAFAAGYYQLPVGDPGAAISQALALPPQIQLMTVAIAIAPLGFIWLAAATARRAGRLAEEAGRLGRLVEDGGGAPAGPSLGGASEAAALMEESLAAIEERAAQAQEQAARDSAAIAEALERVQTQSDRLAADVAQRVAEAMGRGGAPAPAGRAPEGRAPENRAPDSRASAYAPPPAPEPRQAPAANDAIARAAEAARGAMAGAGAPPNDADERSSRIDALRRKLEGRGGRAEEPAPARQPDPAPYPDEPPLDSGGFSDFDDGPDLGGPPPTDVARAGAEIDWAKLVRAANFPDSEDDRETLDALYAVLTDPEAAALLQSAEDALSALADVDLYMEDMQPHHAPAELWRSYIVDGDRRNAIDLGGIRDTHAIEDVAAALQRNQDFGAVADRFMDRYETILERLFTEAPSAKFAVELADTRSGRAYMLLARSAGRFG